MSRVELFDVAQCRQVAPRFQERFLSRVLGEVGVVQDEACDRIQAIDGPAGEHCERLAISAARALHKLGVHTRSLVEWPI